MAEPAAHCTNRFHLSWPRLQDLKDEKSCTTDPKAVDRENFFWKAKDPSSLGSIILEREGYALHQFKFAVTGLVHAECCQTPAPSHILLSPTNLPKTASPGLWGGHTNLSNLQFIFLDEIAHCGSWTPAFPSSPTHAVMLHRQPHTVLEPFQKGHYVHLPSEVLLSCIFWHETSIWSML